jgi:hypothetical protein
MNRRVQFRGALAAWVDALEGLMPIVALTGLAYLLGSAIGGATRIDGPVDMLIAVAACYPALALVLRRLFADVKPTGHCWRHLSTRSPNGGIGEAGASKAKAERCIETAAASMAALRVEPELRRAPI